MMPQKAEGGKANAGEEISGHLSFSIYQFPFYSLGLGASFRRPLVDCHLPCVPLLVQRIPFIKEN